MSGLKNNTIQLLAMALDMPVIVGGHPNKVPFTGVLCKLDEPSDAAPNGSRSRRVLLPSNIAAEAIPSLLGMGVDCTKNLDGHDAKNKIGVITEAYIEGKNLCIKGFLYAADFPEETQAIQSQKNQLGFSFEAEVTTESISNDLCTIDSCIFTGAAILYKNLAAYTTTSLQAKNSIKENEEMSAEKTEVVSNLEKEVSELTVTVEKLKAANELLEKSKISSANLQGLVQTHTDNLRSAADVMCASGIGTDPNNGHVVHLRKMASSMDAEASRGVMPHVYRDHDFYNASSDKKENESKLNEEDTQVKEVLEKLNSLQASNEDLKKNNDLLSSKITDFEKSRFEAAASPVRETLPAAVMAVLKQYDEKSGKSGIHASQDNSKLSLKELDDVLSSSGMNPTQKIAAKISLQAAGKL